MSKTATLSKKSTATTILNGSMVSKLKYLFILSAFVATSVFAVENRTTEDGMFEVSAGWDSEPAYEDVFNAFSIVIHQIDDIGIPTPVSTIFGDSVELDVNVMYLKEDTADAKVIHSTKLDAPLLLKQGTINTYVSHFRPTRDGAYGFHVIGTINGLMFEEVFICGAGSQDTFRSVACVEDAQSFPGDREDDDD